MRRGWIKGICAFFCIVFLNIGIWGSILSLLWFDQVPEGQNFYESNVCWRVTAENLELVQNWLNLKEYGDDGVYTKERMDEIRQELSRGSTNFRFWVADAGGNAVLFNLDKEAIQSSVYRVHTQTINPYVYEGNLKEHTIQYGVAMPLAVEDAYQEAEALWSMISHYAPMVLGVSIACVVLGLVLLILLFCGAGRRVGREEVVLNWHDKIPYDLYLAVQIAANGLIWGLSLVEGLWYLENAWDLTGFLWVAATSVGGSILILAFLLTTVSRIKARMIFTNTIIWRLCKLLWKGLKKLWAAVKQGGRALNRAFHTLAMVPRIVVLFLLYLVGALILTVLFVVGIIYCYYITFAAILLFLMILAIPVYHGFVLFLICRWVLQWRKIRAATQAVVAGQTEVQIDTEKFYPDLKEHAEQLNGLGLAIDNAVGERMKSERFKAELITNVSHDLKTPLTSIINYVDLLKKEEIDNPTAQEYIEVLDRKSQRLKKLTEDLVEASKASTGALVVNKERLDVVQLVRQALGEYEEKLSNAGLTLVTTLPEQELYINGDGRHVWRVLDNLLGNCAKYAMEGTRVYLDLAPGDAKAVITVKNISRNPLNVPPEQLMERFVRGDESRTTEGSGLGLSIARSLAELQGGEFSLDIDGDLFKAKVALPLAEA